MSSLFGVELPTPVNFVIAFVFVLLLIGAAAWLVRRFGVTRIDAAARGRQPRLAVIDSAAVDGRRKLVIIRRDNVEHLLMIGGPSDVVVETNIVRGTAAATRDVPPRATALPRPCRAPTRRLPDPTPWPLQPEPARSAAAPTAGAPTRSRAPRPTTPGRHRAEPVVAAAAGSRGSPGAPGRYARRPRRRTRAPCSEPVAARPGPRPAGRAPSRVAPPAATSAAAAAAEPGRRTKASPKWRSASKPHLRRPMAQKVVAETQRVTATVEVKAGTPKAAVQPRGGAQPSRSSRAISNKRWQVF